MPYPPFRGDKLKIYNLASQLAQNHELHLLTIAENQEDVNSVESLLLPIDENSRKLIFTNVSWVYRPKWVSAISALFGIFSKRPIQVSYFRSKKFSTQLKKVVEENQYDAIHVQHLRMAQYFEKGAPGNAILDLPDAFSLYWKRRVEASKNIFERWFRHLEYQRLKSYELKMLPIFKKALVCSTEDKKYLNLLGITNIDVLPNGVNLKSFSPRNTDEIVKNRILFTGNMDYAPNVDSVHYFVKEILPIIEKQIPDVEFVIAGQRPVKSVLELASSNVKVTGFIENLADEYAKANVVVSPLRIGAGTQNKVLEALAMNLAVVCSNVGFAGLGLKNGEGILMAEDPQTFANHVIAILESEELRVKLGEAGGEHIRNTFAWTAVSQQLLQYFDQIKS